MQKPQDIFDLLSGDIVSKRNLYDLIQYSKVENSEFWGGPEYLIGNTPQQGINWIGRPPNVLGVVIKTRPGSYEHDGWSDGSQSGYRYSFKARNGVITHTETANQVLISQPQHHYPVFLFTEQKDDWVFQDRFAVSEIGEAFVTLERQASEALPPAALEEVVYREGRRRYVTHLLAERSRSIVDFLKKSTLSTCDICEDNFLSRYGVRYIEAHHKIPIYTFEADHEVKPEDFALLCPNCHRAVHIYMKEMDCEYQLIKERIQMRLLSWGVVAP